MKPKLTLSFAALLVCMSVWAQLPGSNFHGIVRDSVSGQVLEGATVSLVQMPDSMLLRQTRSVKGGFRFARVAAGRYVISISYIGYRNAVLAFGSSGQDTLIQLPPLRLVSGEKEMLQVVVRASIPPVVAKSDTLVYNASAFKTRPNATVEDLLRKLPGVQVDKDGQVTVNGQRVDKFYIDGKEITLNNVRSLTRSLTSDMVAGVDAFDRQSDDSRFTGVKDRDGAKALNIRVKKQYQQSITGKAYAGYGESGTYGAGANGFYLAPGTRGQLSIDHGNNNGLVTANTGPVQASGAGINKRTAVNLMGNTELWPKAALNGNLNYGDDHTRNESGENRQTFTGDSSLLSKRQSRSTMDGSNFNTMMHFRAALDSSTEVTVLPRLTMGHNRNMSIDSQTVSIAHGPSEYLSNKAATQTLSESDRWTAAGEVNIRHRFARKGESIRLRAHGEHQHSVEDKNFLSSTITYDSTGEITGNQRLNQVSRQTAPTDAYGVTIGYTYPVAKSLILDASYDIENRKQNSDKATFNLDTATGKYDLPDTLTTNRFKSGLLSHRFSIGLNKFGVKGLGYQIGLAMQTNHQESHNFKGPGQDIDLHQTNWFPRAGIFYTISKTNQLQLTYNGNTIGATVDQLQPLPDLSNPLLIRKGNPGLRPEFDHNVQLGYQHFSTDRLQSLMVQVSGNLQQNKFALNTTLIAGGVQEIQYINTDGNYSGQMNVTYNFALAKGRKGNGQVSNGITMNHVVSYTGGVQVVQSTWAWTPNASFNYSPLERLLLEARAQLSVNQTKYSNGGMDLSQTNQQYSFGVSYDLPVGLLITSDLMAQVTGPQGGLKGQSQELWNATISRRILPKKELEIRCSAYDIMDSNKGFFQAVGDNYISTSNNLVLGRTVFVTVVYYFKKGLLHP